MYYYIFEQAQNTNQKRLSKKIKELCGDTGIAGETVSPSPARTIDELAAIGTSKGYSTVVAVGTDIFLNKVASALINHTRGRNTDDRKIVLGVIPWDPKTSYLSQLIGISSHKHAVETLKFRKLQPMALGVIEPNKYFISPITIKIPKRAKFRISTADFDTHLEANDLSVSKDLELAVTDTTGIRSLIGRTWQWLMGKQPINQSRSIFRHHSFTIESNKPLPVTLEGETIAKTPITVKQAAELLQMIQSRDRMSASIRE